MSISPISRLALALNLGGEGRSARGQSQEQEFAGYTFPVDTVHLSAAAQAYLERADSSADPEQTPHL
jgi:hypothetical protein